MRPAAQPPDVTDPEARDAHMSSPHHHDLHPGIDWTQGRHDLGGTSALTLAMAQDPPNITVTFRRQILNMCSTYCRSEMLHPIPPAIFGGSNRMLRLGDDRQDCAVPYQDLL